MHSVDIGPISQADQQQTPVDLFLIFVGANIVATTLQVGASLPGLTFATAMTIIAVGSIGGALLVAALAPVDRVFEFRRSSRRERPSAITARSWSRCSSSSPTSSGSR